MTACAQRYSKAVWIETSYGELVDKTTILEIKCARLRDPVQRDHAATELNRLHAVCARALPRNPQTEQLRDQLKAVNEKLWDIEDALRSCERTAAFGPKFVALARAVYKTNDHRAALKRAIDDLLDCALREQKSYAPY